MTIIEEMLDDIEKDIRAYKSTYNISPMTENIFKKIRKIRREYKKNETQ